MIGLDLRGCVHIKRVKLRIISILLPLVYSPVFLKFSTHNINFEFHIHRTHMEIGSSEVIKFRTRKMIKKTYFMSPCKMSNLFQNAVANLSPQNVSYGKSCPQCHKNKVSRPSAILGIISN